jgi:predicted ArsR family transcriptional regulator
MVDMPSPQDPADAEVRAVGRLAEPVRRRLYDVVARRDDPVSREEAARAVGISRSLAAYHLDTMVQDGLLAVSYARTTGRTGPGAGRTAKLYRRSGQEFAVTVPPRDYQMAASLLATALEADATGTAAAALEDAAHRAGVEAGQVAANGAQVEQDAASQALRARGYEPELSADGTLRLRNCPFHRLVKEHRDLVCHMNLSLLRGVLDGLGWASHTANLDPTPGYCCVALHPAATSASQPPAEPDGGGG